MSALRRFVFATALVGALLPASQARANVNLVDLEDEVMCVVCERPLKTSGGEAADEQRAVMQRLIDEGLTKEQIKARLVDEYGERVLVQDDSPLTVAAPVLAAAVGAGSIVVLLRRRRRDDEPATAGASAAGTGPDPTDDADADAAPDLSAADDARIEAELAEDR
jgi:cytochrome c-type biogenesis protein CcmH/NrfF